ncbi:MAG: hypothetical protein EOP04_00065 [Proteobacteria bacterium]|nr:MAG: hypothetical protein EOP04_00065 [Pseudomonadota bacterium]
MPAQECNALRGINLSPELQKLIESSNRFVDLDFFSTILNSLVPREFKGNNTSKTTSKACRHIAAYSATKSENEVLFVPGSEFRILQVKYRTSLFGGEATTYSLLHIAPRDQGNEIVESKLLNLAQGAVDFSLLPLRIAAGTVKIVFKSLTGSDAYSYPPDPFEKDAPARVPNTDKHIEESTTVDSSKNEIAPRDLIMKSPTSNRARFQLLQP